MPASPEDSAAAVAAHTPGPWTVDPENDVDTLGPDGKPVALCYYKGMNGRTMRAHGITRTDAEAEANARLIAAAPDLLASLRGLVAAVERTYGTDTDDIPVGLVTAYLDAQNAIDEAANGPLA